MQPALRVGLLLDSARQPNWVARLVEDVQSSSFAQVVLTILAAPAPSDAVREMRRLDSHLLYRLYTALDSRLFESPGDAVAVAQIGERLKTCPQLRIGAPDRELRAADRDKIRAFELDVLLNLGQTFVCDEWPLLARYGVWSFQHGEPPVPARLGGFWELMEDRPVTASALIASAAGCHAPRVLYRSYAPTDNRSVRRNQSNYLWKTSAFFLRQLKDLYERGSLEALTADASAEPDIRPGHTSLPTNMEMARLLGKLVGRYLIGKLHRLLDLDQWFIAYSTARERELIKDGAGRAFTYVLPSQRVFWADPFPVRTNDGKYIFFEDFVRTRGRAHISVVRVDEHGNLSAPQKVLERPYHLSYPFVFCWNHAYYMLPETRGNRTVELYRATHFPTQWEPAAVLLADINAADATLCEIGGQWWLFVNVAVNGSGTADELHLFHADSPLGPWTPHRSNPVKSDARSARPAGHVLRYRGAYYRPAQDCSGRYGRALVLHRIVRIDAHEYVEEEVGRIEPDRARGVLGTHTLNIAGDLVCLDGVIRLRRLRGGLKALRVRRGDVAFGSPSAKSGFRASGLVAEMLQAAHDLA